MKIYIVIKQTISGWGKQNKAAFRTEDAANEFIKDQPDREHVNYRIEEIDLREE